MTYETNSTVNAKKAEFFDPLFTFDEVMQIIRAGRTTLFNLMRDGKITGVKLGGSIRFRRSEIDRYLGTAKPMVFNKSA